MELLIHFTKLPQEMDLDQVKADLAVLLDDDGWIVGSGPSHIEIELEDERANPKYGILTVRNYLQKAQFAPDTTVELNGVAAGIYG